MTPKRVFISGGTGYIGRPLIRMLAARGHDVASLVRAGSEHKLPIDCEPVIGSALDPSFASSIRAGDTVVHLTGTPKPAPWKGAQFRAVDLVSLQASAKAAVQGGAGHFVYVSVAHPAPIMRAYIEVRTECERILADTGLPRTILRPWYVLGEAHWWPYLLVPAYKLGERIPASRDSALRLGLVTLPQMLAALVKAVERPAADLRIVDVPAIRAALVGDEA